MKFAHRFNPVTFSPGVFDGWFAGLRGHGVLLYVYARSVEDRADPDGSAVLRDALTGVQFVAYPHADRAGWWEARAVYAPGVVVPVGVPGPRGESNPWRVKSSNRKT